jgi:murein DD-endopeptidase MepM/ murein hydrolase activator NlpD
MKRFTTILAALLVTALAMPATGQVTDEDIERARREVNELLAESDSLVAEVEQAWARQFALEKEISDLTSSIEVAKVKIAEAERRLDEVAVEMYMGSTSVASIQVLFSSSDEAYGAGMEYLRNVSGVEDDVVNQLRSFRTELGEQTERLADASEEQEALAVDLEEKSNVLQGDLIAAQGVYDGLVAQQAAEEEARRRAEEERRRQEEARQAEQARNATTTTTPSDSGTQDPPDEGATTTVPEETPDEPPPSSGSGGTCPVAGAVRFSDTWGAPRSGGRAHQGVDMIAARNTPLVAVYSGTIRRLTDGPLSGLAIWLRAENGDQFFYAHLEGFADISAGQHVSQGEVIGAVGCTGLCFGDHLHFEVRINGSVTNPMAYL